VDDRVHAGDRFQEAGAGDQIALDRVDVPLRVAAEDAGAVPGVAQLHHHVGAERARGTSDQDVHLNSPMVS